MKPPSFSIGIEEEYQTVDPVTFDLRSHIQTELMAQGKRVMKEKVKSEMHQSVVEVGTGVCRNMTEAREDLVTLRRQMVSLARDNGLAVTESAAVVINIRQPVFTNLTLVAAGANWRYHDKGQNLGTNWIALAYNDTGWSNGPAQLGYGDNDEATVVGYGGNVNNRFITTYFRRTFVNNSPVPFTALLLRVVRDDGVAVWLNGVPIFRDNLAAGAAFNTLATTTVAPGIENLFNPTNLPPNILAPGTNILAVEIHQGAVDSSDISFDLDLVATLIQPEPRLGLNFSTGRAEVRWPALSGGHRLEQATNLAPPVAWQPVTNALTSDGYWNYFTASNAPGIPARFFRLAQ